MFRFVKPALGGGVRLRAPNTMNGVARRMFQSNSAARLSFRFGSASKSAKPAVAVAAKPNDPNYRNLVLTDPIEHVQRSNVTAYEGKELKEQMTPQQYIDAVPPIEVEGDKAMCNGGDATLGHPNEFIQLNKVKVGVPETCKYCGLRYVQKHGSSGHH